MLNYQAQRGTYNSATECWPRARSGVVRVSIGQALVCRPHDFLDFEELGQEAWSCIIDQFRVGTHYYLGQQL